MTPAPKYTDEQAEERTDGKFISPEVFYEELIQTAPDYLQCRGYGHSWRPHTVVTHGTPRNPSYEVSVICGSCDAVRIDYLDKFGDPIRDSHLHYPQGYVADGSGGPRPLGHPHLRAGEGCRRHPGR